MRLKYQILWVENDSDWAESIEDDLKEIVEGEYGLVLNWDLYSKQDDKIQYNNYDLILMDLNLETEPSGDLLIKSIRDKEIYTDVVFYSADGLQKIKQKAQALDLEGVYFAGRDKDLFINKIKAVIQTTIRKVQDLNNLRGLVMAEVSELDGIMLDLINKYYVQNETDNLIKAFHDHITRKQEERIKNALDGCGKKEMVCYHKWKNTPIQDVIPKMESAQMAKAVNYIVPKELYSPTRANFFEDYMAEIVEIRNQLAHCVSKVVDGKEVLITKKGDKTFSDDDFKEIRKNILKHSEVFSKLLR
jgi:DNA-binding NarL/FixJ family response regulator